MLTDAQLADIKERNRCDVVAAQYVALRRHGRDTMIGPCPACSTDRQSRTATKFEATADHWVCAVCHKGGDVIKLVMEAESVDFTTAIARLGGVRELDAAAAAEAEARRKAAREREDRETNEFRDRERKRIYDIWKNGIDIPGTPAADYLHRRGITRLPAELMPPLSRLRFLDDYPYYLSGARDAEVIHRGPAMLAPIVDGVGKFRGLHTTWLDLDKPKGKAEIRHPQTGELLPAKKVRGSKAGNMIVLAATEGPPASVFVGEGIETVLSVWLALADAGRDLAQSYFLSAVDLGNLGGKHKGSLAHPTLRTAHGRAQGVPGPVPDVDGAGLPMPDSVRSVMIIADGDSDRFTTECAVARAASRFGSAERDVFVAWPPVGMDFNDVLLEGAGP